VENPVENLWGCVENFSVEKITTNVENFSWITNKKIRGEWIPPFLADYNVAICALIAFNASTPDG
jgi:hypothetical protein